MKLPLLLAVILPASIGASTFSPRSRHGYLLARANLSKFDSILTKDNVDVASVVSTPTFDEYKNTALSHRGGDGRVRNVDIPKMNELVGAAFFTGLQVIINKTFKANGIAFPAMLGCTILVFTVLVIGEAVVPGVGDNAFALLGPGTGLLTKWLPVMFVPGLAMLPLAPSIGSAVDIIKVLAMIVCGFGFTMATTGYLVLTVRKAQGLVEEVVEAPVKATTTNAPSPSAKPFTEETFKFLLQGTVLTGALSVAATHKNSSYATPVRTVSMFIATVFAYVFGARLPSGFTKFVHPLVTATVGTLLLTQLTGLATGSSFEDVLKTYKAGTLSPSKAGAGDLLLFLLGPAVGCLSVPMYSRKKIMADNLPVVVMAMICSAAGGLFATAWFIRLLNIGSSNMVRVSLLPRNVTTALAIAITQMLEGEMAIAASVVVLTGIFGATVGRAFLDFLKIEDPVSRGLGMGAAGQGLGVAAIMPETEAFPFAAINMILTAVCATALVSVPAVREMLKNIVGGN